MADEKNASGEPEGERRVFDIDELRRRAICKKRYGRATLTIRRWGGLGNLSDGGTLGKALIAFRAGNRSAADVAWAFVRTRVQSHSPSFSWERAELPRLIDLVTDCSRSPHFEGKTPEALAEELIKAQDDEREQMKRLSEQLSRSFTGITKLSRAFDPPVLRWAEQQRKTMEAITRGFGPRRLGAFGAFSTSTVNEQMRRLGLTESVRKEMFPTLQTRSGLRLAEMPATAFLSQRIRFPNTLASELSRSVNRSLTVDPTRTLPALTALSRQRVVTVDSVLRAATEAATIVEQEGDPEEAEELRAVSAEVVAVAEAPTIERVEQMIARLSERFDERFDDLEGKVEANEERRQSDSQGNLALTLFLFFLATYFAYFLWLLDRLPKK
jgi:hypothetical protein